MTEIEDRLREIVEEAIKFRTEIRDEDYNHVKSDNFKQLPQIGDVIEYDYKRYEVIRREFQANITPSWDYRNKDCTIFVKCISKDDDD